MCQVCLLRRSVEQRLDGETDFSLRSLLFESRLLIRGENKDGDVPVDDGKPKMRQSECLHFDMCSTTSKSLT